MKLSIISIKSSDILAIFPVKIKTSRKTFRLIWRETVNCLINCVQNSSDTLKYCKLSQQLSSCHNEGNYQALLPNSSPVHHNIMNADQMNGIMKARTLLLGWAEMTLGDLAKAASH